MVILTHFLSEFSEFGAFLALLLAINEFIRPEREGRFPVLSVLYVCLAALVFRITAYATRALEVHQLLAYHATLSLLTGPLLLLQLRRLFPEALTAPPPGVWHFIPAFVAFVGDSVLFFVPVSTVQVAMSTVLPVAGVTIFNTAILLLFLHFVFYALVLLLRLFAMRSGYSIDAFAQLVFVALLPLSGAVLAIIGFAANDRLTMFCGASMLAATPVSVLIFGARHPQFLWLLNQKIRREKYEKTRIDNLDVNAVSFRLQELMEREKIFYDEKLSLAALARELQVSRHQLSRILNERFNKSFRDFLNEYRVREAARLLVEEPEKTALRIAFDVGFNNKATFNAQFLKWMGTTPIAFRLSQNRG